MPARKHRGHSADVNYLSCRVHGHVWDDVTGFVPRHQVTYLAGVRITLRCANCTTEREDIWSTSTGEKQQRVYRYPPDYKYAGEVNTRPSRDDLRLLYLQQLAAERRIPRTRRKAS